VKNWFLLKPPLLLQFLNLYRYGKAAAARA
jgi:hypothetical protein